MGRLDPSWSDRLSGMAIENLGTGDDETSELTGPLTDQAALSGVVTALIDMQFEVLSVDREETRQSETS
jgi:hypothetical protein